MKVIGIDLSGPANHKDTVMVIFKSKEKELILENFFVNVNDETILSNIHSTAKQEDLIIGIDAPLSYQDGGGDRPQDKKLREFIKGYGMSGSSIMPPTLTRMVYLTLRGINLTRRIMTMDVKERIQVVEVHPGAAIGTRIDSKYLNHVLCYKKEIESRQVVFEWLKKTGLVHLPNEITESSHAIDACAAALAAWHWGEPTKQATWRWKDKTVEHPFEFCC